jgi:hypothetical protein
MVMNKKGDFIDYLPYLIAAVVVMIIVLIFVSGGIGKASSALGANDADVIAAAAGCSTDLSIGSPDLQKKFCNDFKTIEKKSLLGSILGTSKQLVNCEYLNNSIKTTIASVNNYAKTTCPNTTWLDRCQLAINENLDSSDYSILINGRKCNIKNLASEREFLELESWCFNMTGNGCVAYKGTAQKSTNCVGSSPVFADESNCKFALIPKV